MANLWSAYKFSIAGVPGFVVGLGANYRDKSYSDITNLNSISSFVVANAMFGYGAADWGITLNVKNFTNQRYYTESKRGRRHRRRAPERVREGVHQAVTPSCPRRGSRVHAWRAAVACRTGIGPPSENPISGPRVLL